MTLYDYDERNHINPSEPVSFDRPVLKRYILFGTTHSQILLMSGLHGVILNKSKEHTRALVRTEQVKQENLGTILVVLLDLLWLSYVITHKWPEEQLV